MKFTGMRNRGKMDCIDRFKTLKYIKDNLKVELTELQKESIRKWFILYTFRGSECWYRTLVDWIHMGIDDLIARREQLEKIGSCSSTLEAKILRYGEEEGKIKYDIFVAKTDKGRRNKSEYWLNLGYTLAEATIEISKYQQKISKKGVKTKIAKKGSMRHYTPWCEEYWMDLGYSKEDAKKEISELQTRDLDFFIEKYGEYGFENFEASKTKRKETWKAKSDEEIMEHAIKTTPKFFKENGHEMQSINLFLTQNNIQSEYCRFGSPQDQFFQWIPGTGFRRYDLAVFSDLERKNLKIILEYHGPGHINFSEFNETMRDKLINVDGKQLPFLGTYGTSYDNDKIKRNHILSNFDNVEYIVMWNGDLKNQRGKIEQLSRSKQN